MSLEPMGLFSLINYKNLFLAIGIADFVAFFQTYSIAQIL